MAARGATRHDTDTGPARTIDAIANPGGGVVEPPNAASRSGGQNLPVERQGGPEYGHEAGCGSGVPDPNRGADVRVEIGRIGTGRARISAGVPNRSHDRVHTVSVVLGILCAFQHECDGSVARYDSRRVPAERRRIVRRGQSARALQGEQRTHVARQVHRTDHGAVDPSLSQRAGGGVEGGQAGGFFAGYHVAGSAQPEFSGDAAGRDRSQPADGAVGVEGGRDRIAEFVHPPVELCAARRASQPLCPIGRTCSNGPTEVEVRSVEIELDADEDTRTEAIGLAEVRVGDRVLCYLKHQHLLGQGLFHLPGRDLESPDRNLELLDEPPSRGVRKTPVIQLRTGGMILASAHQAVSDFDHVLPRTDSSSHPDDRHVGRARPLRCLRQVRLLGDADGRPSSGRFGRLLEKDVGVGPSETEPAYCGPTRMMGRGIPRIGRGEHTKRTSIQIDLVTGLLEIGRGWEDLVLHGQHGLQEAHGSRSREQVAGIRLGRPDDTLARVVLLLGPKCLQARELDGISHRRARRVALDHVHLAGCPTRGSVGSVHGA